MSKSKYHTKAAVLKRAQEAKGIRLGNMDKTNRLKTGKGAVGTVIEESWFGYHPNSESEPDFPEAGVELKTVPYVHAKNGEVKAKERLCCNIIDYLSEAQVSEFEDSSFWHKCSLLLLMAYEHFKDKAVEDFKIDEAVLYKFCDEDRAIIKRDWQTIIRKIRDGKAHLLSEGDTLFLSACTKGTKAKENLRHQPNSSELAPQRAYSLKQTYMTHVLRSYIFGNEKAECVVRNWKELKDGDFAEYLERRLRRYFGMTVNQLCEKFHMESRCKNLNEILLGKMLGLKGRLSKTEEFQKAGIVPKTIRLLKNGKPKEDMSFPPFKFMEIIKEEWETSKWHNYIGLTKFLFVVFRQNLSDEFVFDGIFLWNMPYEDLQEMRKVWEKTVKVIKEGIKIVHKNGRDYNNFPKKTENPISHVRPHATKKTDTYPLPGGGSMEKQCFWLNGSYVKKIVDENLKKQTVENVESIPTISLPFYSLRAACGLFGEEQLPEKIRYVECPAEKCNFRPETHFVVQAIGHSMEPKINDGDYCVFEKGKGEIGDIVLVQKIPYDNEYGGEYTIKKYHSRNEFHPLNRDGYKPIVISANDAGKYTIIGTFCCVV